MRADSRDPRLGAGVSKPNGAVGAGRRLYPIRGTPREQPAETADIGEAQVLAALAVATLRDLARALDPGAFRGDHGPHGFTCPDCGRWSAEVIDAWRWRCPCGPHGTTTSDQRTKLALRSAVAVSYDASRRLVETLRAGTVSA
jgi:hypothetical protein